MLQDTLLQQLLKQTALLTQLVCAPAAERQPCQAAVTQQAPEEAVLVAEQAVPSEPESWRERRQKRQGESLHFAEARNRGSLAAEKHSQDSAASLPTMARQLPPALETGQPEELQFANNLGQDANPQEAVSSPRQRGKLHPRQTAARLQGRAQDSKRQVR